MPETNNPIRDELLGQIPTPRDVAAYRESLNRILQKDQARLRHQRVLALIAWVFCATSAAIWIWIGPHETGSRAPFLACIFMIVGAVEVIKYQINAARVQLLVEMKQLQVQLFDVRQHTRSGPE